MTTKRKPSPTPEVDHGGRVFYVEAGKVYEGKPGNDCSVCHFANAREDLFCRSISRRKACATWFNGFRGHHTLHPVQAVG